MIETAKVPSVPGLLVDHLRAAMRAAIVQDVHLAVGVPGHHHRLQPDPSAEEIACIRHLTVVADENPGSPEDARHLDLEYDGIEVDAPMHAHGLDEALQAFRRVGFEGSAFVNGCHAGPDSEWIGLSIVDYARPRGRTRQCAAGRYGPTPEPGWSAQSRTG